MSKKQSNLHSFFQIRAEKCMHRKYFIYDPEHFQAFFSTQPDPKDIFIVRKSGIQLYVRPFVESFYSDLPQENNEEIIDLTTEVPSKSSSDGIKVPGPHKISFVADIRSLSMVAANIPIPVHKSNLQKAIRRGQSDHALFSAWALLHLDRMELLRRLPIIMVEDVTIFDRSTILIWLMMAVAPSAVTESASSSSTSYYTMTEHDARAVLAIVQYLVEQKKISFCGVLHDLQLPGISACESKETSDRYHWEDDSTDLDHRERGEELVPVIDSAPPVADSKLVTIAATISTNLIAQEKVDYRHLSHEDFETRISTISAAATKPELLSSSSGSSDGGKAISTKLNALSDVLIALFYRIKYGGMSGDMDLLTECIEYFRRQELLPPDTATLLFQQAPLNVFYLWRSEPRNLELALRPIYVLDEAIDFHPVPQLVPRIHQKLQQQAGSCSSSGTIDHYLSNHNQHDEKVTTSSTANASIKALLFAVTAERIQSLIWHLDSAINIRRPRSLAKRQYLLSQQDVQVLWTRYIHPLLQKERRRILDHFQTNQITSSQITTYFQTHTHK